MRTLFALLTAVSLSACATTANRASLDKRDPHESFNRSMWGFNQAIDKVAIKPVTSVYRTIIPTPLRRGITRVFSNLSEPFSAANSLLQGKPKRALNSLGRFAINTTIGVGGLADHATKMGLPDTREDFGQTLHAWGAKSSPYLVLPLFGPSTIRDGIGQAVQMVADPARIALNSELSTTAEYAVTGTRVIDGRSNLIESGADAALANAADPYATARSAFFQRRQAQLEDAGDTANKPQDEDDLLQKALDEDASLGNSQQAPGQSTQDTPPDGAADPLPENIVEPQQDN